MAGPNVQQNLKGALKLLPDKRGRQFSSHVRLGRACGEDALRRARVLENMLRKWAR